MLHQEVNVDAKDILNAVEKIRKQNAEDVNSGLTYAKLYAIIVQAVAEERRREQIRESFLSRLTSECTDPNL
jgi:hypothetical protein